MRYLLALIVVIVPAITFAKPSVAVAPFDDDKGGKAALAVEKALEDAASTVVGHKETGKAMKKLRLSGTLDKTDKKQLRKKLEVDVLVEGKVDNGKVELRLSGKGIKTSRFRMESRRLKADLPEELGKRLSPDKSDEDDEEDLAKRREEEERIAKKRREDEEAETRSKKRRDDDEAEARAKKRREAEEDERKPRRVAKEEDEVDEGDEAVKVKKKRKRRREDEDEGESEPVGRHVATQAAIRATAGAGFARRALTYSASGGAAPPPVGTAAPTARVEVEAYPGAMDTLKGIGAGFGIYGHFERALVLSIDVPNGGNTPITQQGYAIGARYRATFGQHAVAFGIGYAARQYTADRSGLAMNQNLDMPDTSYGAVAPNVMANFAASPTVGIYAGGAFELLLKAGQITETYGYAKTIAFDLRAGLDIAFAPRYGMRIGGEVHQVGFTFSQPQRGVSSATDRVLGFAASFEVLY